MTVRSVVHHCFSPHLAAKYGIHEAIIIHHLQYWIQFNRDSGKNFHDGKWWMFQSYQEMSTHFPYLSNRQLQRTLQSLTDQGVIVKGNFHKNPTNHTNWYAFVRQEDFLVLEDMPKPQVVDTDDCPKSDNRLSEIGQSIKDTKLQIQNSSSVNARNETPPPASPVPSAAASSFYPCLLDLDDIPDSEKAWICKTYPEEKVIKAVAWFHSREGKFSQGPIQSLKWACREQPEPQPSKDPDKLRSFNREAVIKNLGHDPWGSLVSDFGTRIEYRIAHDCIQFIEGQHPKVFSFDDSACLSNLQEYLLKFFKKACAKMKF